MDSNDDILEQIDRHLASPNLAWLLGAGISVNAGIPLMYPLTDRVRDQLVESANKDLLTTLWESLPDTAHVEHLLSNIGDYAALAERSRKGSVDVGGKTFTAAALNDAHTEVVTKIAATIRWGYEQKIDEQHPERVGTPEDPIIKIDEHRAFVASLFRTAQAGLQERRGPVRMFCTQCTDGPLVSEGGRPRLIARRTHFTAGERRWSGWRP